MRVNAYFILIQYETSAGHLSGGTTNLLNFIRLLSFTRIYNGNRSSVSTRHDRT